MKDEIEADNYEWDSKTVEDGRYEIRVMADDVRSNTVATKLTGSRISEPIVVDNTGPAIRKYAIEKNGKAATLKLQITDELSVISTLDYTIDSNAEWKGAAAGRFRVRHDRRELHDRDRGPRAGRARHRRADQGRRGQRRRTRRSS